MNKNKIVATAILLCVFGCDKKETAQKTYKEYREEREHTSLNPTIRKKGYKINDDEIVSIELDRLSFGEAFNIQRRAKGEGVTFWWRGHQYITNLKKEETEDIDK